MAEARSQGAWWFRGSKSRRAAQSKPSGHVNGRETVTVVLGRQVKKVLESGKKMGAF